MKTAAIDRTSGDYVMGTTSEEYQRLRQQAQTWAPTTRRILQQIGLQSGMHCLDIGCGPGEVMRLMGEIVGPLGHVTGLDIDGKLGHEALAVLAATVPSQFTFLEQNVETSDEIIGQPFDVTFARIVFLHLRDSLAVLRKMYAWTKPGGVLLVQEYDFRTSDIYPHLPALAEYEKVFYGVFEQAGRDTRLGAKLPAYFVDAGLGQPDGTDVSSLLEPLSSAHGMFQAVYKSVLPRALQLGLTTVAASETFFAEINQAATGDQYYTAMWPLLISAWKRKPA